MKSASVRDLRQNFPRVLAWIQAGEEVVITMRRQTLARLVPWPTKPAVRKPLPDLSARLRKVFGRRIIPDRIVKEILDLDRREA